MLETVASITDLGARLPGSGAERACQEMVASRLRELDEGDVEVEGFPFLNWSPISQGLTDRSGRDFPVLQLGYSGSGRVESCLEYCGNGTKEECHGADGRIAVCTSGVGSYKFLHRMRKYRNCVNAGATGFILVGDPGHPPPLGIIRKRKPGQIPAVSMGYQDSNELEYDIRKSGYTLSTENRSTEEHSLNTAWTIGGKEPGLILAAHCDSWTVGAWDNASGVAALLELARYLSRRKLEHRVTLLFTGAEELGLWGSRHFAQIHGDDYGFAINVDGVGYGGCSLQARCSDMELSGIPPLRRTYSDLPLTTSGDHWSFHEAGIRTIFVTCDAGNAIQHTDEDRAECLNPDKLASSVTFIAKITLYLDSIIKK